MKILGIETSCDETAAAVVEDGRRILSNVVWSQTDLHRRFHGVVPELASRAHMERIAVVIQEALRRAGARRPDAVAYTRGPGLAGALLVGKVAAETFGYARRLPVVGIHHLEGHLLSAGLQEPLRFPCLGLIVSGGHTDLVLARRYGLYRVLGRTRDDAAGEAFDKVAKLLGLGFPGGPAVDRLAREGRPAIPFPRPMLEGSWDFSFSGLKTAVLYWCRDHGLPRSKGARADLAASFQEAVVETLVRKTMEAAARFGPRSLSVSGGVAANSRLRDVLKVEAGRRGLELRIPSRRLATDNGAMIACAAFHRLTKTRGSPRYWRNRAGQSHRRWGSPRFSAVDPSLPFENWA